ncbi:MAG: competence/damage-inducible protein A [Oscillospiraceae bacterium]|nr:competence/damage-inducible protein A [Oscillospiraceae bacterium]
MTKSRDTEIISVGTELLLGRVVNTDARDISEMLSKIGINVKYHTVVGDNPQRLRDCVMIAKQRADIIITTGGLGPTCDDLTKQILAEAFGLKLEYNQEVADGLYEYIDFKGELTDNTYQQAMLPEGCTVFHNTCGTAPGCGFEKDGKTVVMIPGPPKECNAMFSLSAMPYLQHLSEEKIVSHSVCVFGMGESAVDDVFAEEMNAMTNPSMAPYAKESDCLLQITAKAHSLDEAEAMIAPVMEHVCQKLGDMVYGIDVDCIEEAAMALLKEKHMTFATAESCTGGEIAKRFTDLPGASAFFKGGAVTYWNEVKSLMLGVPAELIEEKGVVSYEVAKAMAEGIREKLGTDMAIGVTGLAGPDGDGINEVGTVFIALATEDETFVREIHLGARRTRSFIRRMAGNYAFDMMRRYMSGKPVLF